MLPRESEILHLQFWAYGVRAAQRDASAIYLETEGKNAGCWVMPATAFSRPTTEAEDSKVIVRSNGTVTYVGKDIAYQLWKFGLLGKDFYYRPLLTYPDGHALWVSTAVDEGGAAPPFGQATRVYNVIDSRQSYLQDVVVAGLRALGCEEQADRSIHFSYEMVALSPRCCVGTGNRAFRRRQRRPYVEVSGRKGLGVKADDLMDKLIENGARGSGLAACGRRRRNRGWAWRADIAIGALRYFMLKFTRNSVIAFDFQEALSFEGETGPYVQYAAVRARNILRKLEERGDALPDFPGRTDARGAWRGNWRARTSGRLLVASSKADSVVERAIGTGEPAHVARYAFQLAQAFNNFYHQYPILSEPDRERKVFLLWMTEFFRSQLEVVLGILGIRVPEYM